MRFSGKFEAGLYLAMANAEAGLVVAMVCPTHERAGELNDKAMDLLTPLNPHIEDTEDDEHMEIVLGPGKIVFTWTEALN